MSRLLTWVLQLSPCLVIFSSLLFVSEDLVRHIDLLEFVLIHVARLVWVELVALLVIHVFYVLLGRVLL